MCDGRFWCGGKANFVAAANPTPDWAGFAFTSEAIPGPVAGVYLYGRQDGERMYAVYVGRH
jgi:hypothetical protein